MCNFIAVLNVFLEIRRNENVLARNKKWHEKDVIVHEFCDDESNYFILAKISTVKIDSRLHKNSFLFAELSTSSEQVHLMSENLK